jgi:hypothetical protein
MEPIDDVDLFAFEDDTLGGQLEDDLFGTSLFVMLRNFALNSSALRKAHTEILTQQVIPFLRRPASLAEIYGMTDRSGSRAVNYKVAGMRLQEVQRTLLGLGAPSEKVFHRFAKAIGEDFFEDRHSREQNDVFFSDGLRKPDLRIVIIAVTPAPIGIPSRRFRSPSAQEALVFCRKHEQRPG